MCTCMYTCMYMYEFEFELGWRYLGPVRYIGIEKKCFTK